MLIAPCLFLKFLIIDLEYLNVIINNNKPIYTDFLVVFKLLYLILFLLRDIVTRLNFKILFSYFYSAFVLYLNVFMN